MGDDVSDEQPNSGAPVAAVMRVKERARFGLRWTVAGGEATMGSRTAIYCWWITVVSSV
jgi:hypothetical protein